MLRTYQYKIKQFAWNKSSLLLNIIFQNTQTLQLNENENYLQKYRKRYFNKKRKRKI